MSATAIAPSGRPKWEEDQIKSFVTWANFTWNNSQKARGRPASPLIEDITTDFKYVDIIGGVVINITQRWSACCDVDDGSIRQTY